MSDFLTDFLEIVFYEEGTPNARELAERAARAIRGENLHNEREIIKRQVLADPSTDWRVVSRRYRISRTEVYRIWNLRSCAENPSIGTVAV